MNDNYQCLQQYLSYYFAQNKLFCLQMHLFSGRILFCFFYSSSFSFFDFCFSRMLGEGRVPNKLVQPLHMSYEPVPSLELLS